MKRTFLIAAMGVLLAASALWLWSSRARLGSWGPALGSRELATRVLAEHLASRYPGSKVLVVGNPFTQRSGQSPEIYAFEQAGVRGLRTGFGAGGTVKVVYPELRPEFLQQPESVYVDPKTTTPLSFLIRENAFDQLISQNPECHLIVSLIGVPLHWRQGRISGERSSIRFAFLLPDWRLLGAPDAVGEAFKSEKIAGAVLARPHIPGEGEAVGKNYKAEFERRYFLVTKDNIDELLRSYPQLF